MRAWKTHDLVDLFNSIRTGAIPLSTRQFTNDSILGKDNTVPIVQHDINWPTHMDPDFDQLKPGQFTIEESTLIPPIHRKEKPQWLDALLSLPVGKVLTIRMDGTVSEANKLMMIIKSRIKANKPELMKGYICRSIKGEGKWKDTVIAVRVWRIDLNPSE